ncbi:MAG: asparagine synthase C-terminal domain-containing protein [Oscillospiraceae bacterium]|nr:asparagine synthase C-terminal domain-containing protein [Oscillospiraceae bacterium]
MFKNIYELKPAHFAIYNKSGFNIKRYWKLESKPHTDDFETTCATVKKLLEDSIRRQLELSGDMCTFLSGGLDSSILTYYASKQIKDLSTFSVDYIDNDKNFIKNDFQPNSDKYYIDIMTNMLKTNHSTMYIDTPELTDSLEEAMIARSLPGMADIDSSLLLFCKKVVKHVGADDSVCPGVKGLAPLPVALSGECADEIFGGYPWFFREDALKSGTFPWSIALEEREKLLHPKIAERINIKDYIDFRYKQSLNEVEILETDSSETASKRKIFHLTLNWFMRTLLDRTERMARYGGVEVRIPFCDRKLIEYVWNIPWEMKAYMGREKGLLRYIMEDTLPEEIIYRKKSPYPKTHNPNYLEKVKKMLIEIMENKNAPIHNLVNKECVLEILKTDGNAFTRPWFGQLMTGPQLMAYLIQLNMWLEKYNPKISI